MHPAACPYNPQRAHMRRMPPVSTCGKSQNRRVHSSAEAARPTRALLPEGPASSHAKIAYIGFITRHPPSPLQFAGDAPRGCSPADYRDPSHCAMYSLPIIYVCRAQGSRAGKCGPWCAHACACRVPPPHGQCTRARLARPPLSLRHAGHLWCASLRYNIYLKQSTNSLTSACSWGKAATLSISPECPADSQRTPRRRRAPR